MHDVANIHDGQFPLRKLGKLETFYIKIDKAKLDIIFLTNCRKLGVVPKFLNFNLPYTNSDDTRAIPKILLKSAIRKRIKEKLKLESELERYCKGIRLIITGVEWYTIYKSIQKNVNIKRFKFIQTHEKKLSSLTYNKTLPFASDEIETNLSSYTLSLEELDILKYGLSYSIPPQTINRTDVFTTFYMINRFLTSEMVD